MPTEVCFVEDDPNAQNAVPRLDLQHLGVEVQNGQVILNIVIFCYNPSQDTKTGNYDIEIPFEPNPGDVPRILLPEMDEWELDPAALVVPIYPDWPGEGIKLPDYFEFVRPDQVGQGDDANLYPVEIPVEDLMEQLLRSVEGNTMPPHVFFNPPAPQEDGRTPANDPKAEDNPFGEVDWENWKPSFGMRYPEDVEQPETGSSYDPPKGNWIEPEPRQKDEQSGEDDWASERWIDYADLLRPKGSDSETPSDKGQAPSAPRFYDANENRVKPAEDPGPSPTQNPGESERFRKDLEELDEKILEDAIYFTQATNPEYLPPDSRDYGNYMFQFDFGDSRDLGAQNGMPHIEGGDSFGFSNDLDRGSPGNYVPEGVDSDSDTGLLISG